MGYGVATVPQLLEGISTALAAGLVPGGYSSVELKGSGAIFATILFAPEKKFSYGLDLGIEKTKSTYNYSNGTSSELQNNWVSAMLRGDLKYVNKSALQLYGTLSAGAFVLKSKGSSTSDSDMNIAFQFSPIGVRLGNNVALWAEGGFGFRGLLNAGLSVKL